MSIRYGPYDNGHIVCGLSNGTLLIFSSIDLTKLLQMQIFLVPIVQIAFDPTKLVIATSMKGEVAALSLIQNKVKYVYVEMEHKEYFTIQVPLVNGGKWQKKNFLDESESFKYENNSSNRASTQVTKQVESARLSHPDLTKNGHKQFSLKRQSSDPPFAPVNVSETSD